MPRDDEVVVELSMEIAAHPATVFRCLTESSLLSRWLAAKCTIDARLGGAVRIEFDRQGTVVLGDVVEFQPGVRIAFTWGVATGPQSVHMPKGSTRVTITVAPSPAGSLVTLQHAGLPGEKSRRDHEFGWKGYLSQLAQTAPAAQHPAGFEGLVDSFLAAWAETDAATRARTLSSVFLANGSFRDVHADVRSRAALEQHIATCQAMFPGVRMVRDGAVMHTRSSLLARWSAVGPSGAAVGSGLNHFRLSPTGEIAAVEGFWAG